MKKKWIGITTTGTYYSPWTPYSIASFYFCDQIIIVNGGYELGNPSMDRYNVPLDQVSRDIRRLDIAGKIVELKGFTLEDLEHKAVLARQFDKLEEPWFDMRGLAGTLANEEAVRRGADMILKFDSDQVGFRSAERVKEFLVGKVMYQYEFQGDVSHLAEPGPDSPYNDSVFSYVAKKGQYYGAGMGPALYARREFFPGARCAHLRHANPTNLSEKEKYNHFYGRCWFRYMTNDGLWGEELEKRARHTAMNLLNTPGKPSDVPPPEVCLTTPKKYIEEELAKWV